LRLALLRLGYLEKEKADPKISLSFYDPTDWEEDRGSPAYCAWMAHALLVRLRLLERPMVLRLAYA
jgi:hypothetical protein